MVLTTVLRTSVAFSDTSKEFHVGVTQIIFVVVPVNQHVAVNPWWIVVLAGREDCEVLFERPVKMRDQ